MIEHRLPSATDAHARLPLRSTSRLSPGRETDPARPPLGVGEDRGAAGGAARQLRRAL